MSTLEELKGSLSDMSDEELQNTLRDIRSNRRNVGVSKKKTTTKAKKKEVKLDIDSLSPDMIRSILNTLEDTK